MGDGLWVMSDKRVERYGTRCRVQGARYKVQGTRGNEKQKPEFRRTTNNLKGTTDNRGRTTDGGLPYGGRPWEANQKLFSTRLRGSSPAG
jgi:hypothetical protein